MASTDFPTNTSREGCARYIAPEIAREDVVIAHLGNGASMCAVRDGRAVASTMGFTALDGLPMGTRCG
jgi:acetate kinase